MLGVYYGWNVIKWFEVCLKYFSFEKICGCIGNGLKEWNGCRRCFFLFMDV